MKIYCRKYEAGLWLEVPPDWKVETYHWEKRFVPIKEGPVAITLAKSNNLTWPSTVQEMCEGIAKLIIPLKPDTNFWLVYYYYTWNICVMAAEENYFADLDCEIIEMGE